MMLEWSATPQAPLLVDGVELEYACFGPEPDQAPTLVMLHEGLGSVALWRDIPETLATMTGYGVLVYSRQGYGNSAPVALPRPLDFMTREALDVLPQILDRAAIRQCVLFGHSDGATIAAIYAGSTEDYRVRGLILMAPHFFTEPAGLAAISDARIAYETGDLKARLSRYHADVEGAFNGWAETWLNPAFENWNVGEVIDYFRIPTLAIQGADDQYGTLAQITEIEERSYAPVDTVILNCQHAPHLEARDETLVAIAEFTERLQRIESEVVSVA